MPPEIATPLAGRALAVAGASIVVEEVVDGGGGTDPPRYIAPLHIHHADDEAWYVLDGALRFLLDGEEREVPAGGAVLVPRGTVHTFWNPRAEPARYLLIMTPRIQALIDALHAPGAGSPEAIFAEHRSELLGWP